MSAITDAAKAALTAERTARATAAKAKVATFLGDTFPAADLTVADTNGDLVVFTDGEIHLAVRPDGVHLVEGEPGDWTQVAGPLPDLAALGKALA